MAQEVKSGNLYDRLTPKKNAPVEKPGIYSHLSRPAPSRPEKSPEAKKMQAEISPSRPEKSDRAIEMQGQLLREQGKSIYETLWQDERPYAAPNNSKKESLNHTYETIDKYHNKQPKKESESANHVYETIDKYRNNPNQKDPIYEIRPTAKLQEKIYAAPQEDGPIYRAPVKKVSLENTNSEAMKSARVVEAGVVEEVIYSVSNKGAKSSKSSEAGSGNKPSFDPKNPKGENLVNQGRQATTASRR